MNRIIRWCGAGASVLLVAMGIGVAAPVAAAEAPLTVSLPAAVVIGDLALGDFFGDATVSGCEAGSTLSAQFGLLTAAGDVIGTPQAEVRPSLGGPIALPLNEQWLRSPENSSARTVSVSVACSGTDDTAEATTPILAFGIEIPAGVTVQTLLEPQATAAAVIRTCPGDVKSTTIFSYSVDGAVIDLPIELVPPTRTNSDGTLEFSFQAIREWLRSEAIQTRGTISVTAQCLLRSADTRVPSAGATVTIPWGELTDSPEPGTPPPAPTPTAVAVVAAPAASAASSPGTRTLAATGESVSGASLLGVMAVLLGAGTVLWLRRATKRAL